jgi:hypothetical protein
MIRLILKLVIAALIANAAWRVGSAYLSFYKFKDAVQETVQFTAAEKSDDQLRQRIVELAVEYAVPVTEDNFKLHREVERITVDGAYTQIIEIVPGYKYPWPFKWDVSVLSFAGIKGTPR